MNDADPRPSAAPIVAAWLCVPGGFGLPLLFGLKGLEVWPVALVIWFIGALLAGTGSKHPAVAGRRGALVINLVLLVLFTLGYLLAGSVSR